MSEFHFDLIFLPLMGNIDPIEATYKIIDIVNNEELFTQKNSTSLKKLSILLLTSQLKMMKNYLESFVRGYKWQLYWKNMKEAWSNQL